MDVSELLERIELGEDSTTQFKENINNNTSLAEELVAFSNASGGTIFVGVSDDGEITGLTAKDVRLTKSGADKRRISQEELQRLFQESQKIHADEMLVHGSGLSDIDTKELSEYYQKEYGEEIDRQEISKEKILENLYLLRDGQLTLAGLLLFGKKPQIKKPMFMIKAVSFVGNDISGSLYRDSEDIKGNIPDLFKKGMGFLTRNLHKRQYGKSFNSEGELEIPRVVLEELLVNAIMHRDYFIEAPINIFIFDNRIEIISPGKLPNGLSIENIKHGISVIRNPIITSFASKLLPYRGIGSGIVRAIKNYDKIDFVNDTVSERFKATIFREEM